MKKRLKMGFMLCTSLLMITACGKANTANQIHQHLEETVKIESDFEEQQQEIFELEKKDQEIYEEIISLDADAYDEIVSLSEEAIDLLEERTEFLKVEKESMSKSQDEFEEIESLLDKLNDQEQKNKMEALYDVMIERYQLYDDAYEHYMDSIEDTKELYNYFQKENYTEKELYSRIDQVNESYDTVTETYDSFNEKTHEFNELKEAYYQMLDKN